MRRDNSRLFFGAAGPPDLWSIFGAASEVRVDRFLCAVGAIPSRSQAAPFLKRNPVLPAPDAQPIRSPSAKIPLRTALIGHTPASTLAKVAHIAMYKPTGVVCEHAPPGSNAAVAQHKTVYDILPPALCVPAKLQLNSVGRLDADASGLLILTQSGSLIHRLGAPKNHASKTYLVEVIPGDNAVSPTDEDKVIEILRQGGMQLVGEKKPCLPVGAEWIAADANGSQQGTTRQIRLTLVQGMYHQIKRMMNRVGWKVTAIHRESISFLNLDDPDLQLSKPGDCVTLSDRHVERLWLGT